MKEIYQLEYLRMWKYDIKMDLKQVEWGGMDWICLRIGTNGELLWTR
jgi:hypothetical protein